jgi:hypothetical protein
MTDWREWFKEHGHHIMVMRFLLGKRGDQFAHDLPSEMSSTAEEQYQAFKARLIEELEVRGQTEHCEYCVDGHLVDTGDSE